MMHIRQAAGVTGISAAALALALATVSAQAPPVKRTVLQKVDISTPGREAVTAKADIPPTGSTGRHTHPGEEIGYVAEGTLTLEVEGVPTRTVNAGEAFNIPAGKVHNATNNAAGSAVAVVTYIVEKGKPLTTPVP